MPSQCGTTVHATNPAWFVGEEGEEAALLAGIAKGRVGNLLMTIVMPVKGIILLLVPLQPFAVPRNRPDCP